MAYTVSEVSRFTYQIFPEYTGRICVIGSELKEDKLAELFGL